MTADGYWGYTRLGFGMPVDAVALGATPATGRTVRPMLTLYLYPMA
ncbi:hypothetical protein GXW82_41870 [Streptacidiphilus sp. 4-A2]|nr:hypothetical protein [Streptacidiphilus sp. 4-A2]